MSGFRPFVAGGTSHDFHCLAGGRIVAWRTLASELPSIVSVLNGNFSGPTVQVLQAIDGATGRELFGTRGELFGTRGVASEGPILTPDGRRVITWETYGEEPELRSVSLWELPPSRPYGWLLGHTVAYVAAVIGLWWCARRRLRGATMKALNG